MVCALAASSRPSGQGSPTQALPLNPTPTHRLGRSSRPPSVTPTGGSSSPISTYPPNSPDGRTALKHACGHQPTLARTGGSSTASPLSNRRIRRRAAEGLRRMFRSIPPGDIGRAGVTELDCGDRCEPKNPPVSRPIRAASPTAMSRRTSTASRCGRIRRHDRTPPVIMWSSISLSSLAGPTPSDRVSSMSAVSSASGFDGGRISCRAVRLGRGRCAGVGRQRGYCPFGGSSMSCHDWRWLASRARSLCV